ncbi:DNA repair protein RecN [Dictyobacter aurantiacus]|uniref:DNA repair protein RecN n=1 Tax=Dictyobacter aurantiacus TaxID=1936993 RepID=A0A401ZHF0_9CHLR|nr:DNA repair protein RecN [Dictyobacter aurantiacus]GCE06297.1 DNA repair protein RecN [Dictyobacter aurantiacus]
MLIELTIKDFAIIDRLQIRLNRNFNVFTGETGAGKSIIIDAVNALLGGKIGAEFVRAGCDRATVEGVFSVGALPQPPTDWLPFEEDTEATGADGSPLLTLIEHAEHRATNGNGAAQSADALVALSSLLQEYDLYPEDGQLILTRDIFRSGRTVARINGRALSLHILQQVASWLVDIHGQSENISLLRPDQHINFLDRYAETLPLREQLAEKVSEWRNARKKLLSLQQNIREQERRAEFLRFEIEEIEKANLRPGEVEELEEERKILNNAERLRELCSHIYGSIQGSEMGGDGFQAALDQIRQAQRSLSELVRLDKTMEEYEEALAGAIYQLEDVATSISSYEADIEDDPNRLAEVEERLDLITKLKRKYGDTIEEILQHMADDQAELETIDNRDELIIKLKRQDGQFRREIGALAQALSERRSEAAQSLSLAMEEQLNDLNMRRARFQVEIVQMPDGQGVPVTLNGQEEQYYACDLTGVDRVQFLIAPNPGEPFKPLTKIASGGETSRLMLALKTILADADATPTLIFDEIDAGISGRSGQVVGEKLWQLTSNHQIICVTHLPQIAAFADTHYNVNKQIFDNRTMTIVNELRPEQRVREIAHIMGGNVTDIAMKSAEEMLGRSDMWKANWLRQKGRSEQARESIER